MTVWLSQLAGGDAPVARDTAITGITSDSRTVKAGNLFAALPGGKADGAAFIAQAKDKGATAVICGPSAAVPDGLIALRAENPRRLLALAAARFYGAQPDLTVAVTGTNGKTSVAAFVRQIWEAMGFRAASLGTIGIVGPGGSAYLQHTTPDPVTLHAALAELAADHVSHLALEASSHGLEQNRLDGVRIAAAGFTNLTRDHLDYHATVEDYFGAKMRLFTELLPQGASAVINADTEFGRRAMEVAKGAGLRVFSTGNSGTGIKLLSARREGFSQYLDIKGPSRVHQILLPLAGDFQASNALVALGLVIASGGEEEQAFHALESLKGAKGRLDLAGETASGAPVFVDYAHTPDALENALASLRPYAQGKLAVVFGCGGDRDRGKRPQMGAVASRLADMAIVTDDNPRTEEPAAIRKEILAACPDCIEIGDRAVAIRAAVDGLKRGDVLLVAGKGHEEGQIVGGAVIPFSDHAAVSAALRGLDYHG
jgi:UDP-N-acetylmuramoyl-L-alanyl-D-glutamate--2,6-diaminopimelate ligase